MLDILFKHQKEHILYCINDNENLYILCGKSNHRIIRNNKKDKDIDNNIIKCAIEQVSQWKPSMNVKIKQDDNAFVMIDKNEIIN